MSAQTGGRRYRVAIDTGGTFTDAFFFDEETGAVSVTKVPSRPDRPDEAVLAAIAAAGIGPADIRLLTHGTTVATNALITRRLARAAMICTRGHRDVVEIRDGTKPDLWDAYVDVAEPYIRRRDRFEVDERIDYAGRVLTPLDEAGVRDLARILKRRGYEAVAVCFLNSYANPAHELRCKEILAEELGPDVFLCASAEIVPEMFEHPRHSTAMINAATGPVVSRYIERLDRSLKQGGYAGDLLILHSGGGVLTAQGASRYAARLASSGIVAGAIAGAHIAGQCGFENAISLDMGGTSTDISLCFQGRIPTTQRWQVEYGYPIMFPSVEVITIGAGGGSIAWIDQGGSLRNGPQSAGADPGPACYGTGGEEPTNTDANLLLGRLGGELLDGKVRLDADAARRAIHDRVGAPLSLDDTEAAHAILRVANANMANAVKLISVGKGFDPRDFALVVFGGAGPLHGADLARDLDIPVVIFPRFPGIASAMGCLLVDIRHDLATMMLKGASNDNLDEVEAEFRKLEDEARARLREEGVAPEAMELQRSFEMRYVGQWRQLEVAVGPEPLTDLAPVLDSFHREHARAYSFEDRGRGVEIYALRVVARGVVPKPQAAPAAAGARTTPPPAASRRQVHFGAGHGFLDTPVMRREELAPGMVLEGPMVIEQLDSTVILPPGTRSEVTPDHHIVMRFV
ncbi:MAG: hydantoinase/oxoprolinase family protein [Alphaproteobacteria bacterium]|nr:MAG: hydantoinase/oxoprolinase family protein [Alphaproteobacteria bacterium]